jgi:DNA-binding MarR family transcriptional regulator
MTAARGHQRQSNGRRDSAAETRPLAVLLQHVGKLLDDRMRKAFESIGLHAAQAHVLRVLASREGVNQRDLADQMMIAPPTMSGILSRMAKAGFVERRDDPEDERAVRVYLTRSGRNMCGKAKTAIATVEAELIEGFSATQLRSMHLLLRELRGNLGGYPPDPEENLPHGQARLDA